jgi:hypothetical protein
MVPNPLVVLALISCVVLHAVQASVTAFNGSDRGNLVAPGSEDSKGVCVCVTLLIVFEITLFGFDENV